MLMAYITPRDHGKVLGVDSSLPGRTLMSKGLCRTGLTPSLTLESFFHLSRMSSST